MLESLSNNIFTYKKLTESEQQQRGILGRLAGVIADTKHPTRNGRQYSSELWENVFNDPVMQEKIANRCCFGELGHPADREEVDMEKIAICLAEKPKIGKDGNLYGVFDILNTPCGKILKSLCDYGANIGVSSRGSGDVMSNDEVDPETYNCECWDAVVIPAVKSARPKYVTESLNKSNKGLKTALLESLRTASDSEQKIMKEALKDLHIDLLEKKNKITDKKEDNNSEDDDFEEPINDVETEEQENSDQQPMEYTSTEDEFIDDELEDSEDFEQDTKDSEKNNNVEYDEATTVKELVGLFDEYDKDAKVFFMPFEIDGKTYYINALGFDSTKKNKLLISIDYSQTPGDNIDDNSTENEILDSKENSEEAIDEVEPEEPEEEAIDDGAKEALESLREFARQNELLESKVKALKKDVSVSRAEVTELKESLAKYKIALDKTRHIADVAKQLNHTSKSLKEELESKEQQIKNLSKKYSTTLNESLNETKAKLTDLMEELDKKDVQVEELKSTLSKKVNSFNTKLDEQHKLIESYKNNYEKILNKYVAYRASMLGVKQSDITNKLNENYSIEDVENVCNTILTENVNTHNLPYNFDRGTPHIKITEQKTTTKLDPLDGYDIDDSLLELAGLK